MSLALYGYFALVVFTSVTAMCGFWYAYRCETYYERRAEARYRRRRARHERTVARIRQYRAVARG